MNKENSLREIIYSGRRERNFVDGTELGGIIFPLIKMNEYDVYIYGGGTDISSVILYFWNCGIQVKGVFDCDKKKEGKLILGEVPIIYPYSVKESFDSEKTMVIINTMYFKGIEQTEIMGLMLKIGIVKYYEIKDLEKEQMKVQSSPWVESGRVDFYRENVEKLEETYKLLWDDESRAIMLEFIRVYMQFSSYQLPECHGKVKYFYGKRLWENIQEEVYEEIYEHYEDEVWINCGSCIGDTIFWYFANAFNAKGVYAYEGDKKVYERLCANLKYLPDKFKDKVIPINEYIDDKTDLESILGDDKITLINADIEGCELELIENMSKRICSDRPVLAISVYHKASDLIEIPQYINKIVDDYCFILRKYENEVRHVKKTGELVLYAIPKERNKVIN